MPLDINDALLRTLDQAKLFVDGRVVVERGVDLELFDSGVSALEARDLFVCPDELKRAVAAKCNLLSTQAVFYTGELMFVESEMELAASRFEYMDGNATLVVTGELFVAPDVEPKALAERLDRVHNLGEIYCSPAQMGAIQSRLGISEGELLPASQAESDEARSNLGYLAL